MRRVVVTGLGIVSSIGNNADEVTASLRETKSGITFSPDFAEHGFKCQVWGQPTLDPTDLVDRRAMRFLSQAGAWNHVAMKQAIADAGLEAADITNERTGIIMGSGGASTRTIVEAAETTRKNVSPKRIGPFAVPKAMSSTASATLATWFQIHGVNYSISSACSTSAHCIGNAAEMIQWGKQDVMFAGGHEDLDWTMSNLFDAMGAMSSKYNDTPSSASRAYDVDRDGFVIAGGAGVLVLEELEHAKARGAKIYAEIVGYGATSDGYDMVAPSGEGAVRCMRQALSTVKGDVDYINTPRNFDAGRRPEGDRRHPRGLRREDAAHPVDQIADRSFAGRRRRAGIDLRPVDDAGRLYRRKRPYRHARPRIRRRADRPQAHRQRQDRHGSLELLRFRRHQRDARLPALQRITR
ncbi:3-oxoacyl-[acyl-carrier-protein] synthase-1 [Sinorhizobium fredii]